MTKNTKPPTSGLVRQFPLDDNPSIPEIPCVYLLSSTNKNFYIGCCGDVRKRLQGWGYNFPRAGVKLYIVKVGNLNDMTSLFQLENKLILRQLNNPKCLNKRINKDSCDFPKTKMAKKKFFKNIEKRKNGHWRWKGETSYGLPVFTWRGKRFAAKRLMYFYTYGELIPSDIVEKTCGGTKACLNPEHLLKTNPTDLGVAIILRNHKKKVVFIKSAIRKNKLVGMAPREAFQKLAGVPDQNKEQLGTLIESGVVLHYADFVLILKELGRLKNKTLTVNYVSEKNGIKIDKHFNYEYLVIGSRNKSGSGLVLQRRGK